MDKASTILESLTTSSPPLLVGYQRLSSDPLLVGKDINLDSSLVHPPSPEPGCPQPVLDKPLAGKSVNSDSALVLHFVLEEHHDYTAHVLLVSSDSPESENDPPISTN